MRLGGEIRLLIGICREILNKIKPEKQLTTKDITYNQINSIGLSGDNMDPKVD